MSREEHTLEPIFDKNSKTLILGSFPSVESREVGMYFANKTNRFWYIISSVYKEKITDRRKFILKHHLALWDVIESCNISYSNDSSIKNVKVNDIGKIISKSKIKHIFLLGKKAYELYYKYLYKEIGIKGIYLPSTSGANTKMSYFDLIEEYKIIKKVTK